MISEYIKYSNLNSTFNRKKLLTERDNVRRVLFLKMEFYTHIKKVVINNKYVPKSANYAASIKVKKMTKLNPQVQGINKCLWTGRKHGVYLKYKSGGLVIKNNPNSWYFLSRLNK